MSLTEMRLQFLLCNIKALGFKPNYQPVKPIERPVKPWLRAMTLFFGSVNVDAIKARPARGGYHCKL